MRVNKSDWLNSQSNPKALRRRFAPSARRSKNILYQMFPVHLPGWVVTLESSHTRRLTIQWLISKAFNEVLNKTEKEIFLLSSLDSPTWLFEIVVFLYKRNNKIIDKRILKQIGEEFFKLVQIKTSRRVFRSFRPELSIYNIWAELKKIPPLPYVGVGYSDKGSLGSALAWQEQQLPDSEEYDLDELSSRLLTSVELHTSESLIK